VTERGFEIGKPARLGIWMQRVNRWLPSLGGLSQTLASMRFNWRRVLIKEYSTWDQLDGGGVPPGRLGGGLLVRPWVGRARPSSPPARESSPSCCWQPF